MPAAESKVVDMQSARLCAINDVNYLHANCCVDGHEL